MLEYINTNPHFDPVRADATSKWLHGDSDARKIFYCFLHSVYELYYGCEKRTISLTTFTRHKVNARCRIMSATDAAPTLQVNIAFLNLQAHPTLGVSLTLRRCSHRSKVELKNVEYTGELTTPSLRSRDTMLLHNMPSQNSVRRTE